MKEEKATTAEERYRDIIHLPRPVSKNHRPMDRGDRAAQFAPFAALGPMGKGAEAPAETAQPELDE